MGEETVIHVHIHTGDFSPEVVARLDAIDSKLATITSQEESQVADLTRVSAEVTEIRSASESAKVLLGQLAQMIRDNKTDQDALDDLADQLDAEGTSLAAAVTANDPNLPAPTPEPPVEEPGGTEPPPVPPVEEPPVEQPPVEQPPSTDAGAGTAEGSGDAPQ